MVTTKKNKRFCSKCDYVDEILLNKNGGIEKKRTCKTCGFYYFARVKGKRKKRLQKELGLTKKNKVIIKNEPKFYETKSWLRLKYDTLKKHDRKCMVCFRTRVEIHVDHIKPRSLYPELELDPNNLQVLCRDCNLGKSNRDEIDWRPQ